MGYVGVLTVDGIYVLDFYKFPLFTGTSNDMFMLDPL